MPREFEENPMLQHGDCLSIFRKHETLDEMIEQDDTIELFITSQDIDFTDDDASELYHAMTVDNKDAESVSSGDVEQEEDSDEDSDDNDNDNNENKSDEDDYSQYLQMIVRLSYTVLDVKYLILMSQKEQFGFTFLKICDIDIKYKDEILDDWRCLEGYGIDDEDKVEVVLK